MLERHAETETVFTSPDPREAEDLRRLMAEHGFEPEMRLGADPVTGVGAWVYGGSPATFYNLEVPLRHAERARKLLAHLAGPARIPMRAEAPVEEARPRARAWIRHGWWLLVATWAGSVLAFVTLATPVEAAGYVAMLLAIGLLVVFAVRSARRRSGA